MATFRTETLPNVQLRVHGCAADVRINGHEQAVVEVTGDVDLEGYLHPAADVIEVRGYPGSLMINVPRGAVVELSSISGEVEVTAVAQLTARGIGDVRVAQVSTIQLSMIDGDVEIEGESERVELSQVGGDVRVGRVAYLDLSVVGGDVELRQVERLHGLGHIGGDLRLAWSGSGEGNVRGMVGGDVALRLPDNANLTLTAVVGGDLRGSGTDWQLRRGAGRHRITFGNGSTQLTLTTGGDLTIEGGTNAQHSGAGMGDWQEMWGSMDAFGEEMRGLGSELEGLGRNLARELGSLGREIAREVRVAGREARHNMKEEWKTGRGPRMRVRFNDREFNFDPEQVERIKREARAAAASGIARAQEAVEQALRQWQEGSSRGAAPRPPVPPVPPRPYTGQTVRIEREGDTPEAPQATPRDVDAERLAILRMVHEGRLSPDEAEMLLRGLDDRA